MPIDEQAITRHFSDVNHSIGDIQEAFSNIFTYVRHHQSQFERIHCQELYISPSGLHWDYLKIKNGIVITKSRLIRDLQRDIDGTLAGMPPAHIWLEGIQNKRLLLMMLNYSYSSYFLIQYDKHGMLKNVSDVIGLDLRQAVMTLDDAINQKDDMVKTLQKMKNIIIKEHQRNYVCRVMINIKKLSRGQTIMGKYFKYTLGKIKHLTLPLPNIITHAKTITLLKRHTPGKRQNLSRRNMLIHRINRIKHSKIMYFVKTNDSHLAQRLTGSVLIKYINVVINYLNDKN